MLRWPGPVGGRISLPGVEWGHNNLSYGNTENIVGCCWEAENMRPGSKEDVCLSMTLGRACERPTPASSRDATLHLF